MHRKEKDSLFKIKYYLFVVTFIISETFSFSYKYLSRQSVKNTINIIFLHHFTPLMIPYARFTKNRSLIDLALSTDSSSVTNMNRDGLRGRLQIVPRLLPLESECHLRGIIASTPRKMSTRRSASNVAIHLSLYANLVIAAISIRLHGIDRDPPRPCHTISSSKCGTSAMNAIVIRYGHACLFFYDLL